jgi:terminase small subunit-like protein
MARPSRFSKKLATAICDRIAEGESLRSVCRDQEMPDKATVFRWLYKREDFRDQYARATAARADAMAEEIIEIADTPVIGERSEEGVNADGEFSRTVREDAIQHRRLQVDTRKWIMARMQPKKYGDKIEQTHRGDEDAPVQIELIDGTATNGPPEARDAADDEASSTEG